MSIDRRKAIRALKSKGFREDKKTHHVFFFHEHDGKETGAFTKVSHTKKMKVIDDSLLKSIRRQLRLETNAEAEALLECPMSAEQYLLKLGIAAEPD